MRKYKPRKRKHVVITPELYLYIKRFGLAAGARRLGVTNGILTSSLKYQGYESPIFYPKRSEAAKHKRNYLK